MSRPRPDSFRAVFFDCDSTLSTIEGVDELTRSRSLEVQHHVEELTRRAMEGQLPLSEVYPERLQLLQPGRDDLDQLGLLYVRTLVPGARQAVATLQDTGITVGIVSGGLEPAVRLLAEDLGVEPGHVHAVPVHLDETGAYRDFDRACPLTRNQGKVDVLTRVAGQGRPLCFVGDGVTDLEAAPVVDWFVGFGGVARRTAVVEAADAYLDGPGLEDLPALLLS